MILDLTVVIVTSLFTFILVNRHKKEWGKYEIRIGEYKIHHSVIGISLFLLGIVSFSENGNIISSVGLGIYISHIFEELYYNKVGVLQAITTFITRVKQPEFEYEEEKKERVRQLQNIKNRLKDEVGTVIDYIKQHNTERATLKKGQVFFWAGVRLLFPVIEATAKTAGIDKYELMEKHLGIITPHLTWQIFRHSLIHDDEIRRVKYKNHRVGWKLILNSGNYEFSSSQIGIDLFTLYDKLISFLEAEIGKNDKTLIDVKKGINYTNPKQYIIDDFKKLSSL